MASRAGAASQGERAGSGDAGQGQPRVAKSKQMSESRLAKVFLAPSLVAMALVALFPILYAAALSLLQYSGLTRQGFAGLSNFAEAVTSSRFWDSVIATLVFTVGSVTFEFLIGLGFALIMNRAFFGRGVVRATILIPWVIPTVIAARMWYFMFFVDSGFVNLVTPFPSDFNWLGQPGWAMFSIIFADVWKTAPFVALLLLAGLQTIPADVYESARVDGASAFQSFWRITLPLLRPAILVSLLFRTVDALRAYDLPAVMTRGTFGTETLSIIVNQYVINTPDPGLASALSTVTFIVVLAVGVLFVALLGRNLVLGEE